MIGKFFISWLFFFKRQTSSKINKIYFMRHQIRAKNNEDKRFFFINDYVWFY